MHAADRHELDRLLGAGLHPSVVLDEMMQRWNRRWLMDGETARCRQCDVPQWPSSAHQPLDHRAGCTNATYQHPWLDLAELLSELPMAPL